MNSLKSGRVLAIMLLISGHALAAVDTKDWKVYKDEADGFELRFPADWDTKFYPRFGERQLRLGTHDILSSGLWTDPQTNRSRWMTLRPAYNPTACEAKVGPEFYLDHGNKDSKDHLELWFCKEGYEFRLYLAADDPEMDRDKSELRAVSASFRRIPITAPLPARPTPAPKSAPPDTKDWLTWETSMGWSMKYPRDWHPDGMQNFTGGEVILWPESNEDMLWDPGQLYIQTAPPDFEKECIISQPNLAPPRQMKIAGQSAERWVVPSVNGDELIYCVYYGDRSLRIELERGDYARPEDSPNYPYYEAMLSTLKFEPSKK